MEADLEVPTLPISSWVLFKERLCGLMCCRLLREILNFWNNFQCSWYLSAFLQMYIFIQMYIYMCFPKQHLNLFWQVEEIREMVDNDLGFQQAPLMCYSRTKTLLFISNDKKVIGCLIAEHIQWVSDWIGERQPMLVLSDSVLQTFWNYRITWEFKSKHLANNYSMYVFSRKEEASGGRPFWNVALHFL